MSGGGVRLFVALDLPPAARGAAAEWAARELGDVAGVRLVAADALHATLRFLGECDPDAIEALGTAVTRCARPVAGLRFESCLTLPPRRPRVVALALHDGDGGLAALHTDLQASLESGAGVAPEARALWPHVTVARVRRGARAPTPCSLATPPREEFAGDALTLYRSELGAGPARYVPLARAPLAPRR